MLYFLSKVKKIGRWKNLGGEFKIGSNKSVILSESEESRIANSSRLSAIGHSLLVISIFSSTNNE